MTQTLKVRITERGAVPRRLSKVYTRESKASWYDTGKLFHGEMRDKRFTQEHARVARYVKRAGEEQGLSERAFRRTYTGKKERKFGHRRPLEFSGETRRLVRTANISSTTKGASVRYPGARKFNFRNPHTTINKAKEFRHLTAAEKKTLAANYDDKLNAGLNRDNTTETRTV
jgi:hypothetical protein